MRVWRRSETITKGTMASTMSSSQGCSKKMKPTAVSSEKGCRSMSCVITCRVFMVAPTSSLMREMSSPRWRSLWKPSGWSSRLPSNRSRKRISTRSRKTAA